MTLIGAMIGEDEVLVASDSMVYDQSTAWKDERETKLWPLANNSLVWGFAGDAGIGQWIGERLAMLPALGSWDEARQVVTQILASVFGEQRGFWQLARQIQSPNTLPDILVAGYISGEPRILAIDSNLAPEFTTHGHSFIGAPQGCAKAGIVIRTLRRERGASLYNVDLMATVLDLVIDDTLGLGGAPQIWRITPDGASQLQGPGP